VIKIKKIIVVWLSWLLFVSLSAPASAKDRLINDTEMKQKESIEAQVEATEPKIIKELVERRKPNEKTHLLEDGSMLLEIHQNDIHYVDLEGQLQDINTDLIDELGLADAPLKNYSIESMDRISSVKEKKKQKAVNKNLSDDDFSYTSLKTPFIVDIPKTFVKGYGIEQGGKRLKFIPVNSSKTAKAIRDRSERNKVVYKNAWPHTDVELIVMNEGIKENIILHNASAPLSFSFEVQGNLDDFNVLPAWLEDSKGTTREVALTKRVAKNKTYVDLTWNSEGLQYPILIDPTIYGSLSKVINIDLGSSFTLGSGDIVLGGRKTANSFTETYRSYLQFTFTPIKEFISSSSLRLERGGSEAQTATTYVDFQPVEVFGDWVEPMNAANMPAITGLDNSRSIQRYQFSQGTTALPYYEFDASRFLYGLSNRGTVNVAIRAVNSDSQLSSTTSSESIIKFRAASLWVRLKDPVPSTPTNFRIINSSNSSVTLAWDTSTYTSGIASYEVLQASSVIQNTTNLSATISIIPGSSYSFTVRAVGNDGARSEKSSTLLFTFGRTQSYTYSYSNAGQLLKVVVFIGKDQYEKTFIYDENGNLVQVKTTKIV